MTEHARRVLRAGRELASPTGDQEIHAGHVLRAILADKSGNVAMSALIASGITDIVDGSVERVGSALIKNRGRNVNVDALVSLAVSQAKSIGHWYAGPEHLLLAMLDDAFWPAVEECFAHFNLTRAAVRREVFYILGKEDPSVRPWSG